MNPNLSRSFTFSLTDLKSRPRSFASAYIEVGFLCFKVWSILDFSFESKLRKSLMSEKSCDFFSPVSFDTKLSSFALISTYLVLLLFFCAISYMG